MDRGDEARAPATGLGRQMRERIQGLKPDRQPLEATNEQRQHWRSLGQERFQDPEYQRWAQSHRSRESLQEAGRLGYAETARKYGPEFADGFAAQWRLDNPTQPEKRMMELLRELGFEEGRDYEREAQVGNRRVDFAFHERKVAIEVHGGVHEEVFRERFGAVESGAEQDDRHNEEVKQSGYHLLIAWRRELEGEELPGKRDQIRSILGDTQYGNESPWA